MTKTSIKVYSTTWCPDCVAAKRALEQRGLPFEEINIENDPSAAEYVMSVNGGKRSVPTLVSQDVAHSLSRFSLQKLDAFLQEAGLKEVN